MSKPSSSTLRIIGGEWRRRNIRFLAVDDLRPTPDRVRETLFNWLQFDIRDRRCLDAFAGSGALGLEALSRGAASCCFLEKHPAQARHLQSVLKELAPDRSRVLTGDSLALIPRLDGPFDLVFLDPPYALNFWQPALDLLTRHGLLATDCTIYVEADKPLDALGLPDGWECLKSTKAGTVQGFLLQRVQERHPS